MEGGKEAELIIPNIVVIYSTEAILNHMIVAVKCLEISFQPPLFFTFLKKHYPLK